MTLHRSATCAVIVAVIAISGGSTVLLPGNSQAKDPETPTEADGTLHIHNLTIPLSDFLSPELKNESEKAVAAMRKITVPPPDPHPEKSAPKAEWDRFYADQDRMLADPLEWDREHYPVNIVDTKMAGIHVGVISPKDGVAPQNRNRVLINLHGGGYVDFAGLSFGELESIPVASMGKFKVITVDYRQSPDYQYPAASEDVEAVYRELLKQYRPEAIGIYGCSAGGTLTAQAVAWFQAKGLPRPGAVGIFCQAPSTGPFMGVKGKQGDARMWGLGLIPENEAQRTAMKFSSAIFWYLQSAKTDDPVAYPGLSDTVLEKFPPTLLLAGTREFTLDMAVVAHAKFLRLGVDSYLYIMEGAMHATHVLAVRTPEAHDANAYIAHWFEAHLAQ